MYLYLYVRTLTTVSVETSLELNCLRFQQKETTPVICFAPDFTYIKRNIFCTMTMPVNANISCLYLKVCLNNIDNDLPRLSIRSLSHKIHYWERSIMWWYIPQDLVSTAMCLHSHVYHVHCFSENNTNLTNSPLIPCICLRHFTFAAIVLLIVQCNL